MKQRTLTLLIGASLSLSSLAMAQDRDHDHDRRGDRHDDRRSEQRYDHRHDGPPARVVVRERGAGPRHDFYRGRQLPREYRERRYVVQDWHGRHLSAPPRGYHWVQTGNDYVLVSIVSGIIAQVLLSQ